MKLGNLGGLWNEKDAERGVLAGLIVATVVALVFSPIDQDVLSPLFAVQIPYGALWYALNFTFSNVALYKIQLGIELFVTEAFLYWLVRKGKIPKHMFYLAWFVTVFWIRATMFQNVTVTMLTPLIFISPAFVLIPILQKLPLGWSLVPWNDVHWQCAFDKFVANGQNGVVCDLAIYRFDPYVAMIWEYAILGFMVLYPMISWYIVRRRKK